jgi:Ribbon-helix-helix protein, copG family
MAGRKRLDPSTSEAPGVTVIVTIATRARLAELAVERGISRSALMRELIELGLEQLDASLEVAV